MDLIGRLRETTTVDFNQIAINQKNLKRNVLTESNKYLDKPNANLKNFTSKLIESKENSNEIESIEKDVSMMSITDDCHYYLPTSQEFKDINVIERFTNDAISRRNINRDLTVDKLHKYSTDINFLAHDCDTGDVLVLEILDHMVEIECSQQPLGKYFLDGTVITPKLRHDTVNYLFNMCQKLETDRYSVHGGMAIADRYVKAKGFSLKSKDYVKIAVTCWFIACKWDLIQYPCIEDVVDNSCIENVLAIQSLEIDILQTINFYLGMPTPILFLRPLSLIRQRQHISHNLAKLFIDICLQKYELAGHPSHIIAAACYSLSMSLSMKLKIIKQSWPSLAQFVSGLDVEDFQTVMIDLIRVLCTTNFHVEMESTYRVYESFVDIIEKKKDELQAIAEALQN